MRPGHHSEQIGAGPDNHYNNEESLGGNTRRKSLQPKGLEQPVAQTSRQQQTETKFQNSGTRQQSDLTLAAEAEIEEWSKHNHPRKEEEHQ